MILQPGPLEVLHTVGVAVRIVALDVGTADWYAQLWDTTVAGPISKEGSRHSVSRSRKVTAGGWCGCSAVSGYGNEQIDK